jgi:hypothetical protein
MQPSTLHQRQSQQPPRFSAVFPPSSPQDQPEPADANYLESETEVYESDPADFGGTSTQRQESKQRTSQRRHDHSVRRQLEFAIHLEESETDDLRKPKPFQPVFEVNQPDVHIESETDDDIIGSIDTYLQAHGSAASDADLSLPATPAEYLDVTHSMTKSTSGHSAPTPPLRISDPSLTQMHKDSARSNSSADSNSETSSRRTPSRLKSPRSSQLIKLASPLRPELSQQPVVLRAKSRVNNYGVASVAVAGGHTPHLEDPSPAHLATPPPVAVAEAQSSNHAKVTMRHHPNTSQKHARPASTRIKVCQPILPHLTGIFLSC